MSANWNQIFTGNPTTTFQSNDVFYLARSPYSPTDNFGFTYSSLIPLTAKGDIFVRSASAATRLPVGLVNGQFLQVNSIAGTGLGWSSTVLPQTTTANELLFSFSTNTVQGLPTANNGVLVTDVGGVPSIGSTLPTAVQGNINSLGTIGSGTWQGSVIGAIYGGTAQSTYTLGDILYSSAANTLSKLSGNTTATKNFLTQTGTGAISAAPSWSTISASDIGSGAALTKTDDTNVTLTLGGSPSTALLSASSITAGWTGQLSLSRGGSNASLTADLGGIIYSTASSMAVLAATATAGQMLQSGANSAPSWSTATYPSTTTINQLLYSSANNVVGGVNTVNSGVLATSSTGVPTFLGSLTDGQIIIGSTGVTPVAASLTAGAGINITAGAGSISIASTSTSISKVNVTGTSQALAVNTLYTINNAGLVTLTLPVSAAVGDQIFIRGSGAGGWTVAQGSGQSIKLGSVTSTTGVGGSISSSNRYDCIELTCIVANITFNACGIQGAITYV